MESVQLRRVLPFAGWVALWTVVILLLRIAPYIDHAYPRDTIGGEWIAVDIVTPVVLALVATSVIAGWLGSKKRALLLLPPISLVLAAAGVAFWLNNATMDLEPIRHPVNVYLAIGFGAPLFGIALVGRRAITRYALLAAAIAAIALLVSSWESYGLIVKETGLLEFELPRFAWKIPVVGLLTGAAAAVAAYERRSERKLRGSQILCVALPAIAAIVLLVPARYPGVWRPADIARIEHARLLPSGNLLLDVTPAGERRYGAKTTLVQRRGDRILRCPFRRPVIWFEGWPPPSHRGTIGRDDRVPLLIEASLLDLIRRRPRSLALGDPRSGSLETICEEIWKAWSGGRLCTGAAIGPNGAWAVEMSDAQGVTVHARMQSGRRVRVRLPQFAVIRTWFSPGSVRVLWLREEPNEKRGATGVPQVVTIDSDTGKGRVSRLPIPGASLADVTFSPDAAGFVVRSGKWPGTLSFVDLNLNTHALGTAPRSMSLLWQRDGTPRVFDDEGRSAMFGIAAEDHRFIDEMTQVSGRTYALVSRQQQYEFVNDVYELDANLTRATLIGAGLRDVQWLADSIIYVVPRREGDQVIRRWPSGKQTVLVAAGR